MRGREHKVPKNPNHRQNAKLDGISYFFPFCLVFWSHSSSLIFSSLFLALARSCSLALARSSSLFLALPRSSSLFSGLVMLFFFCFSLCFAQFSFLEVRFCLLLFIFCFFSIFHVFSLCFALSRFLLLCLPLFLRFFFFFRFAFPPRCCD